MTNTLAENRARKLPSRTAATSQGRVSGSPLRWSLSRNAGGPPGSFLAFEKLLHGVPIQTAQTQPARSQPKKRICTTLLMMSYPGPMRMSHRSTGRCSSIAFAKCPDPQKSSTTIAIARERAGASRTIEHVVHAASASDHVVPQRCRQAVELLGQTASLLVPPQALDALPYSAEFYLCERPDLLGEVRACSGVSEHVHHDAELRWHSEPAGDTRARRRSRLAAASRRRAGHRESCCGRELGALLPDLATEAGRPTDSPRTRVSCWPARPRTGSGQR